MFYFRGVATGYIGIYTPKSVYLTFFMWLFCLLDPGQIRYRAIYTHPNQIPGYASVLFVYLQCISVLATTVSYSWACRYVVYIEREVMERHVVVITFVKVILLSPSERCAGAD